MPAPSKLLAWAELTRISNAPTVITNVLTGASIALITTTTSDLSRNTALLATGVTLLYLAGMALNDLADRDIDAKERPNRPIPSGRISVPRARAFVLGALTLGLFLSALAIHTGHVFLGALIAAILAYDLARPLGMRNPLTMGLCRGLTIMLSAVGLGGYETWPLALTITVILTAYTIALTLVARYEADAPTSSQTKGTDWRIWGIAATPAALCIATLSATGAATSPNPPALFMPLIITILATLWLISGVKRALKAQTVPAVLTFLAGFCLLDATVLAALDLPLPTMAAVLLFTITTLAHRRILGT